MKKLYPYLLLALIVFPAFVTAAMLSDDHQLPFSVDDSNITIWNGEQYVPLFIKGINLGIAVPGTFPGELRASRAEYGRWMQQIRDAGFNVIRVYTLHYPHFYEVLDSFNLANPRAPLFLMQGVWLEEEQSGFANNLFNLTESFTDEIETNVDCIHGNRNIPHRYGKAYGEYTRDVSRWVMAWIIGREVHPAEVLQTDKANAGITSHKGRYFSIDNTKPTEAWFTKRLDHLVSREQDLYQTQRPVSVSSWPTLDPLHHPWEDDRLEDTAFIDLSTVDYSAAPAGMFMSYHAYPYYPDFVSRSPEFSSYSDSRGKNPYLGYLTALKNHYRTMPLIIAEFGSPSGIGIAHYASNGIHHGGADHHKQANDNLRMLENIYNSGAGGGIQFAWMDEWFKRTWLTDPLDYNPEQRVLWHNLVSAEQNFGLMGFRKVTNGYEPWETFCDDCHIRSVEAFADYTYFNIRIAMEGFLGIMDTIWVALDTYDAALGESLLPTGHTLENRAEFLLMITNHSCLLFVTQAYDQFGKWHRISPPEQLYRSVPSDGAPWRIVRFKNSFFEQEIQYIGNLNFRRLDHPMLSNDIVVLDSDRIDIKLPWTLINFSAPPEMAVIHDYRSVPGYQDTISDGIALTVIHNDVTYSTGSRFKWEPWLTANDTEEYLKDSYYIMRENLWQMPGNPIAVKDSYRVPGEGILNISSEKGLLSNDLSLEGSPMTAWLEMGVPYGNLKLNPDGSFKYISEPGTAGEIYFTYRVSAGGKMSEPASVRLKVEGASQGGGFLKINPNPTDGIIQVDASSYIEIVELFNQAGRLMLQRSVNARTAELDISAFPPGIYTVRVFSGRQWVARKIVLIR
jgi:hypothetical protein